MNLTIWHGFSMPHLHSGRVTKNRANFGEPQSTCMRFLGYNFFNSTFQLYQFRPWCVFLPMKSKFIHLIGIWDREPWKQCFHASGDSRQYRMEILVKVELCNRQVTFLGEYLVD